MGSAVSTLITKVQAHINETSTTFHTSANLIAYADEGQKYLSEILGYWRVLQLLLR